jgi:hypothetical protein
MGFFFMRSLVLIEANSGLLTVPLKRGFMLGWRHYYFN